MLVTPAAPFTMPSLDHLDGLVEQTASRRAAASRDLREITTDRWTVAYHSFRRYLHEPPARARASSPATFRTQRRMLEDWIAWMRASGLSRNSIATYWRGVGALLGRIGRDGGMLNPLLLVPAPKENLPHPSFLTRERAESLLALPREPPRATRPSSASRDLCLVGLMVLAGPPPPGDAEPPRERRRRHGRGRSAFAHGKGRHGGRDRTAYMTAQLDSARRRTTCTWRGRHRRTHPEFLTSVDGDRAMGLTALRRRLLPGVTRPRGADHPAPAAAQLRDLPASGRRRRPRRHGASRPPKPRRCSSGTRTCSTRSPRREATGSGSASTSDCRRRGSVLGAPPLRCAALQVLHCGGTFTATVLVQARMRSTCVAPLRRDRIGKPRNARPCSSVGRAHPW